MNLDKIINELNFTTQNKSNKWFYKVVEGYVFTLFNDGVFALGISCQAYFELNRLTFIDKYIKKKNIRIANNYSQNDTLLFILDDVESDKTIENCACLIKNLIIYFKEQDYKPYINCRICKQTTSEIVRFGTLYEYGHQECLDKYKQLALESLSNNVDNPLNLIKSIIFSLIGAILGLGLVYLCYFYMHSISLLLISLLPILSFKGYQLGKAIMNKKATICTIVFSSLAVFMICILIICQGTNSNLSGLALKEAIILNSRDLILTIVFYGLGLFFSYRFITNTNEKKKKDIEKL